MYRTSHRTHSLRHNAVGVPWVNITDMRSVTHVRRNITLVLIYFILLQLLLFFEWMTFIDRHVMSKSTCISDTNVNGGGVGGREIAGRQEESVRKLVVPLR